MPRIRATATALSVRSRRVKIAMLLLAAGRGTRFGGEVPKAFLQLAGKPLLLHAAERLCRVADPRRGDARLIVVVHRDDRATHLQPWLPALRALGVRDVVDGGDTRQASMQAGLAAAGDCDLVLVHDAARCLFPVAAATACVQAAAAHGAALLAIPVPDTLKQVQDGRVRATLPRDGVYQAQTPQVVRADLLRAGLATAIARGIAATDDVALAELAGAEVAVVPGSPANLKITRAEDLALAAAILAAGILDAEATP
jgi:2-C-methyl-D-erythritol 4-phosphate cytidylyltransferase